MRAFWEKRWVRLLALALFFLLSAGAMMSFCLYSFALQDGWYGKEDYTFADTAMARQYTLDALNFVSQNLAWLGDPGDETLGSYGGDGFAYRVEDYNTGRQYADTTSEGSYLVMEYPQPVATQKGDGVYRLFGYVNLPVQPYWGCYREYYVFSQLFPLRGLYLPLGVGLALLAAGGLAIAMVGAVSLGKKGRLTLLGRLPFDGAAAGLYAIAELVYFCFYPLLSDALTDILTQLRIYQGSFHTLFMLWYAALLALILANQLSARAWQKKLLLRRLAEKIPFTALLVLAFAMHIFLLIALLLPYYGVYLTDSVLAVFDYSVRRIVLILLVTDLVLLPLAIRWDLEKKRVRQATDALARGELSYKLNTAQLHFVWRKLGGDLNSIGDGMAAAVEQRLRSERMKTELITNVSHDLKTPLTSIINYIALLKEKDLPPETQREYLDVLDRQSAKLKKLTEDVVEASKAASGVMPVHPELLDVGELLVQSVGEYAERLEAAGVTPVIHTPEQEVHILADGRLLGRVLDNFITNIIKYAQPGTRAYFDLTAGETDVVIAVKNTSRAPLDMPAEELMERFVRGDSSRSTEGSGLGLSIARSLTELIGGQMRLTLDGDLFKAEVTFPIAPPDAETDMEKVASPD